MAQVLPLPVAKREKPISVIMVSYMTGPALLEAIHAVMADKDIFELIPAFARTWEYRLCSCL